MFNHSLTKIGVASLFAGLFLVLPGGAASALARPGNVLGHYTRTMTQADLTRAHDTHGPCSTCVQPPVGRWGMTISPGRLSMSAPDGGHFQLKVSLTASTLTALAGNYCPSSQGLLLRPAGRYRVARKGSVLTITALADPCQDRHAILVGTWRSS